MKIGQNSELPVASTPAAQSLTEVASKAKQPSTLTQAAQANKSESNLETKAAEAKASGVKVSISSEAKALDQAQQSQSADMDMAKVEAVRSQIQQGTYQVNPEAIADKLLANAQEMLQRTKN